MEGKEVYQCKWLFGIMDKRYHKRHALALAICHARSATSLLNTDRVFDPKKYDTR